MYSSRKGLVLGFHGADKLVVDKVISGQEELLGSENEYDWLGNGIYFGSIECSKNHYHLTSSYPILCHILNK